MHTSGGLGSSIGQVTWRPHQAPIQGGVVPCTYHSVKLPALASSKIAGAGAAGPPIMHDICHARTRP